MRKIKIPFHTVVYNGLFFCEQKIFLVIVLMEFIDTKGFSLKNWLEGNTKKDFKNIVIEIL